MAARGKQLGDIVRANMVLKKSHAVFLEQLILNIFKATNLKLERSAVVRALIESLEISGIDLTKAKTEADVIAILTKAMTGGKAAGREKKT